MYILSSPLVASPPKLKKRLPIAFRCKDDKRILVTMAVIGYVQFSMKKKKPLNVANEVRKLCQFKEFCYLILKPQFRDALSDVEDNMIFRFSCISVTDKCYGMDCGKNAHCIHKRSEVECVCDQGSVMENGICVDKFFESAVVERDLVLQEFESGPFDIAYDSTASFEADYQYHESNSAPVSNPYAKKYADGKSAAIKSEDDDESGVVKPDEDTTVGVADDDTTVVKLDEDTTAGQAADDESGVVKPDEDTTVGVADDDTTVVKLDEDTTAGQGADDESGVVKPNEDTTVGVADDDTTVVKPDEDTTAGVADDDTTVVKPDDDTTAGQGADDESGVVKPDEDTTVGQGADDESGVVKPDEDTTAGVADDDTTVVKPDEDTTVGQGADDESGVVKPDEDTTAGQAADDESGGESAGLFGQPSSAGDIDAEGSPAGSSEVDPNLPNPQDASEGRSENNPLPNPRKSGSNAPVDGSAGSRSACNADAGTSDSTTDNTDQAPGAPHGRPVNGDEHTAADDTSGSSGSLSSPWSRHVTPRPRERRHVGMTPDGTGLPFPWPPFDSASSDPSSSSRTNQPPPPTAGSNHDAHRTDERSMRTYPSHPSSEPDEALHADGVTDGSGASSGASKWAKIIRSNHLLSAIVRLRTGVKPKVDGGAQGDASPDEESIHVSPQPLIGQGGQSSNVPTSPGISDPGALPFISSTAIPSPITHFDDSTEAGLHPRGHPSLGPWDFPHVVKDAVTTRSFKCEIPGSSRYAVLVFDAQSPQKRSLVQPAELQRLH
ncbi:hypothetical protein, conserved [Babesia bigemina]|uniref:Uncharacterized protein n=1 Tax=Babesia bigemina TaxID=5866 RepID=A0A061D4L3_BABBI|nr:hypothetical protein, conserved [Babesia bigemina]CDR93879.1 hypothetical protein, conserved [Babesia bigemina]|eukprot:XP_012766065.1 hypothetical protein, conserved [Babesia bigemina]